MHTNQRSDLAVYSIHEDNQARPLTTTPIRLGILVVMKFNIWGLASKLRFGYLPPDTVANPTDLRAESLPQIRMALQKLINTFVSLGGNTRTLRMSILAGKGNTNQAVAASSERVNQFSLSTDVDWQALQQINRISSPLPATVSLYKGLSGATKSKDQSNSSVAALIKAASSVLNSILKLLASAKANDPNDPIPDEYLPDELTEVASDDE